MGDMTPEQTKQPFEAHPDLTDAILDVYHSGVNLTRWDTLLGAINKALVDTQASAIRDAEERGRLAERLRIAAGIGFMASEYEAAGRDDAAKAARGLDKWVRSLGDAAIRAAGERESDR